MTLKYQTESLEGLPEAVHSFYEQGENGYTLKVEGVVPETKFKEVNQRAVDAAEEARRRRATVERVTGKLGLEGADGLDEALDALMSKPKAKDDAAQQAIVEQIRAQADAEKSELQQRLSSIAKDAAASNVKSALAQVGFHPEALEMVALQAMGRVQIDSGTGEWYITKSDGSGPLAGNGPGGNATASDLASELAAAMPSFLTDQGKGGGGKPPASGANGGAKTVTRSQFNNMTQADRATFSKSGGKVVEG